MGGYLFVISADRRYPAVVASYQGVGHMFHIRDRRTRGLARILWDFTLRWTNIEQER
jgi:hypothetical protein